MLFFVEIAHRCVPLPLHVVFDQLVSETKCSAATFPTSSEAGVCVFMPLHLVADQGHQILPSSQRLCDSQDGQKPSAQSAATDDPSPEALFSMLVHDGYLRIPSKFCEVMVDVEVIALVIASSLSFLT